MGGLKEGGGRTVAEGREREGGCQASGRTKVVGEDAITEGEQTGCARASGR